MNSIEAKTKEEIYDTHSTWFQGVEYAETGLDREGAMEAMDQFAKQTAIAFVEWMAAQKERLPNGNWRVGHLLEATTEELYHKFLTTLS